VAGERRPDALERFIIFKETRNRSYLFVFSQFRTENRFTLFLELL